MLDQIVVTREQLPVKESTDSRTIAACQGGDREALRAQGTCGESSIRRRRTKAEASVAHLIEVRRGFVLRRDRDSTQLLKRDRRIASEPRAQSLRPAVEAFEKRSLILSNKKLC